MRAIVLVVAATVLVGDAVGGRRLQTPGPTPTRPAFEVASVKNAPSQYLHWPSHTGLDRVGPSGW